MSIPSERSKDLVYIDVEDYLDEDPVIPNQRYFLFSYLLPDPERNELEVPLFKMRGAYKTMEECQKKADRLTIKDKHHTIHTCETGKFGGLYSKEYMDKNDITSREYKEAMLNTMNKKYKENVDKGKEEFQTRKEYMHNRAKLEGSKKGQKVKAKQRENFISVEERKNQLENQIKDLNKRLAPLQELLDETNELLVTFTEEEIKDARTNFAKYQASLASGHTVPSQSYLEDSYFEEGSSTDKASKIFGGVDSWLLKNNDDLLRAIQEDSDSDVEELVAEEFIKAEEPGIVEGDNIGPVDDCNGKCEIKLELFD